jgi:hypothetical protein
VAVVDYRILIAGAVIVIGRVLALASPGCRTGRKSGG